MKKINETFRRFLKCDPSAHIRIETRLHFEDLITGVKGKVDAIIVGEDIVQIIDLKTVKTSCESDSDQTTAYATAGANRFKDRNIVTTIIQFDETTNYYHVSEDVLAWAEVKRKEVIKTKASRYSDPHHELLYELLMEMRQTLPDEKMGELLDLANEMASVKALICKHANKEAETKGKKCDGYGRMPSERKRYANIEEIRTFMLDRGYTPGEYGTTGKVVRKSLIKVLTPEHFEELTKLRLSETKPKIKPLRNK